MEHLTVLGFVFLNMFMIVGTIDLFYYHLWKYKLHTRPESRYEHKLHMTFAFLMVPLAFFLYYQDLGGLGLWTALFFVIAVLATEMLDVLAEGKSRSSLGGLTTGEYSMHVAATVFKVASFTFMFAAKPAAAWGLSSPTVLGSHGAMGEMIAIKVMIGSLLIGLLHAILLTQRFGSLGCHTVCDALGCKSFPCCSSSTS